MIILISFVFFLEATSDHSFRHFPHLVHMGFHTVQMWAHLDRHYVAVLVTFN